MRQKLIKSIFAMFNDYHGNETTPNWLQLMTEKCADDELIARMQNWRRNYPELWQRHGIYVM